MKLNISKVLCLSVLISVFSSTFFTFNAYARNKIIPNKQMKMAPVVSQEFAHDQIQDNFQEAYQENDQQNLQNPEDLAYLDKEIPTQTDGFNFDEGAPQAKTEENSAQLSEAQDMEPEYQNQN